MVSVCARDQCRMFRDLKNADNMKREIPFQAGSFAGSPVYNRFDFETAQPIFASLYNLVISHFLFWSVSYRWLIGSCHFPGLIRTEPYKHRHN